jgi:hypothetical protein
MLQPMGETVIRIVKGNNPDKIDHAHVLKRPFQDNSSKKGN